MSSEMHQREQTGQRILGLAGWSGSGKTTLGTELIQRLTARGLAISTLKHAHHAFDIDHPGKDSHRHRQAGAGQVMITSANRWALMSELRGNTELTLDEAIGKLGPCDLILVEGFKGEDIPKLEVHRPKVGKPLLYGVVPGIQAIATDSPLDPAPAIPTLDLNDIDAIEAWVLEFIAWHN